jgi:hypothetical protein
MVAIDNGNPADPVRFRRLNSDQLARLVVRCRFRRSRCRRDVGVPWPKEAIDRSTALALLSSAGARLTGEIDPTRQVEPGPRLLIGRRDPPPQIEETA